MDGWYLLGYSYSINWKQRFYLLTNLLTYLFTYYVAFHHVILQDISHFTCFSFYNADIFLCDAAIPFGQYFSFCFGFSQVMSVIMNLSVMGGGLTLCITSLNFFDFSTNRSLWKTLCLSVSSDKQLRIFWGTSVGQFCCVYKFRNDDSDCCKVKMFPWGEITVTAHCTISLRFLLFDVPFSPWLMLMSRPSRIFDRVRLWNKSSIKWVSWKTRFHSAT